MMVDIIGDNDDIEEDWMGLDEIGAVAFFGYGHKA